MTGEVREALLKPETRKAPPGGRGKRDALFKGEREPKAKDRATPLRLPFTREEWSRHEEARRGGKRGTSPEERGENSQWVKGALRYLGRLEPALHEAPWCGGIVVMGGLWGERFAHPKGRAEEKAEDAPEKALMPGRAKRPLESRFRWPELPHYISCKAGEGEALQGR